MKELSEPERVLDALAVWVRNTIVTEAEVSRVLDVVQRETYSEEVAALLRLLDDCPSEHLMQRILDARTALEHRKAPERNG